MIIKDIQDITFDKVVIYTKKNDSWDELKNLYKGDSKDIPHELLNKEIHLLGARRKGILDISII